MTLAYLESLPLLELLQAEETRTDNAPLRLHPGTSLAIREQLQLRGLVTPPDFHGWSAASLTAAGRFVAQKLRLDPPAPPRGLGVEQCRALGHLRRQELSDQRANRANWTAAPRERSKLLDESGWLDLQTRGLVRLVSPSQPPKRPGGRWRNGSAILTRRGREIADDLLGGAGGHDVIDRLCVAPPPFVLRSCSGGVG